MKYQLQNQKNDWADAARKKRGVQPIKKDKAPILRRHLFLYWEAFWELSTDRHELGPIPFSALDRFCRRHKIKDFDSFTYIIREMDSEYLRIKNNERDAKLNKDRARNKGQRK